MGRSEVSFLPDRSPKGSKMVQRKGESLCREDEGVLERQIGDVIQTALSNQTTWWCFGCQWLQERDLLQKLPDLVKGS